MAKECAICGKGSQLQSHYSNRVRATKYNSTGKTRKYPNLQQIRLSDGKRVKACTHCIKNVLAAK